ncbi:MAG: hypothetical protein WBO09_01550 [Methylocystis silviterrae]|uniref:hypothetical protein n=1 Tax=Methylocystis silviterrae TaxID=2743612 RepID=UPI003C746BE6
MKRIDNGCTISPEQTMSGDSRPRGLHMSLSAFASFFAGSRIRSAAFTSLLSGISIHRFAAWLVGPLAIVAAFFWVANHIGGNVFAVKTKKTDCVPNERFVNDPDGRRFLELRWLMDPPGWRVRLRVPAEYVTWADVGCESATMPGYPDPNYRDVYVHGFSIGVDLPDFTVLQPTDRHIRRRGLDTIKMVVSVRSQAKVQGKEAEKVRVIEKNFYDTQLIFLDPESVSLKSSHLIVGPKQDKFNLKRVGVIGDMSRYKTELGGGLRPSISTMSTENRSTYGSSVRRMKSRITRKTQDGIVAPNARCFSAMRVWTPGLRPTSREYSCRCGRRSS